MFIVELAKNVHLGLSINVTQSNFLANPIVIPRLQSMGSLDLDIS